MWSSGDKAITQALKVYVPGWAIRPCNSMWTLPKTQGPFLVVSVKKDQLLRHWAAPDSGMFNVDPENYNLSRPTDVYHGFPGVVHEGCIV